MTHLSASNSLTEPEKQSQVAVDPIVTLELTRSLDTFPGRRNLDEYAVLGNALSLVELNQLLGLGLGGLLVKG